MSVFTQIKDTVFGRPCQSQQLAQAQRRAMPQRAESEGERPPGDVERVLVELRRDKRSTEPHRRGSVEGRPSRDEEKLS